MMLEGQHSAEEVNKSWNIKIQLFAMQQLCVPSTKSNLGPMHDGKCYLPAVGCDQQHDHVS